MSLTLKGRLKLIADKVPQCGVVADIGTDHAYLPIYLIQQGRCESSIASDVKAGPVNVANRHISKYGLSQKIETRLGSGLETIELNEADTIIIAGMGGTLLAELLEADAEKACSAKTLVLQPMNDLDIVRKWLYDHKFAISDEEFIAEGQKIYCIMTANYDGQTRSYDDFELHVGNRLIVKQDPLLVPYCEMKVRQIERVLGQLRAMDENESLMAYYLELKESYLDLLGNIKTKE